MRIYRRGKTYWAQLYGERFSLKTQDRTAAELAFQDAQRRSADPSYRPPDATTLRQALDAFADHQRARGRAAGSIRRTSASASHLVRVMGDVPIATITDRSTADHYVAERADEGASGLTQARELSAFRGALKLARGHGKFPRPVDEVMPTDFAPAYTPLDRHATIEQINRLRRELAPERAAVVGFIPATAADWRSVGLAQPEDVALDAGTVQVRGTKNRHRWRTLPILPQFRPWLEDAVEHMPFAPWGNAVRDIRAACRRAKIPEVTPRDLRRSHAKILRALGVAPNLIGPMLGHADGRMVERVYGRLSPAELGALVLAQAKPARRRGTKTVQRRPRRRRRAA